MIQVCFLFEKPAVYRQPPAAECSGGLPAKDGMVARES